MAIFEIVAIIYVASSALTSIVLLRSPHFDRVQKLFQGAVVWLLPIVGAVVILVFHSVVYRNMRTRLQPSRPSLNRDETIVTPADFD